MARAMESKLTQKRLLERLHYDPVSGIFTTRSSGKGYHAGSVAGTVRKNRGYVSIGIDKNLYLAHRLAWLYMTGEWPPRDAVVEHKDNNPSNNSWENLRLATQLQNCQNQSLRTNNTSGRKRVCWHKGAKKWQAHITVNKKVIYLGLFEDPDEAHEAYRKAALEHFGEFANFG